MLGTVEQPVTGALNRQTEDWYSIQDQSQLQGIQSQSTVWETENNGCPNKPLLSHVHTFDPNTQLAETGLTPQQQGLWPEDTPSRILLCRRIPPPSYRAHLPAVHPSSSP